MSKPPNVCSGVAKACFTGALSPKESRSASCTAAPLGRSTKARRPLVLRRPPPDRFGDLSTAVAGAFNSGDRDRSRERADVDAVDHGGHHREGGVSGLATRSKNRCSRVVDMSQDGQVSTWLFHGITSAQAATGTALCHYPHFQGFCTAPHTMI